jgi:hypothetical protein
MFRFSPCVREKVSEYSQVILIDRLEDFGHCCIVGMPYSRLVLPQCLEQVIFALVCEPRHVLLSGKIGSMTDIAMILVYQRAAARTALRIADLGWWLGRRKLGYCDGHVLQIFIAPSFRIFVHRRGNSQSTNGSAASWSGGNTTPKTSSASSRSPHSRRTLNFGTAIVGNCACPVIE